MIKNEALNLELEKLINQAKSSLNEVKRVAVAQAWKILQLTIAAVIQQIEVKHPELAGKDKKTIAMDFLSRFYDSVFVIVDVPLVPNVIEPIIHRHIKTFLMILVGSTVDAMVSTFREIGIFKPKEETPTTLNILSKKKTKRKKS